MRFISRDIRWDMMCPHCFYLKPDCLCAISTKVSNDNQSGMHSLFEMATSIAAKALGIDATELLCAENPLPPEGLFL